MERPGCRPAEAVNDLDVTFKVLAARLEPWAEGQRTKIVRITPGFVSGRRLIHPNPPQQPGSPTNPNAHAAGRAGWPTGGVVEVGEAIRRRRMVRAYETRPVDDAVLDRVLEAARRAPSAGLSQPVDLLVLTDASDRRTFWDLAFSVRDGYGWPRLFDAPVVVVPLVEPDAYARRYSLPDKAVAGLADLEAWPVPYWWIDGGAAVENMLLGAVGEGLGASLFGLFVNEAEILRTFGVPAGHRALGGVTIGYPLAEAPVVSSPLSRRRLADIVHRSRW